MKKNLFAHLYVQVLIAIALGITVGAFAPETGAQLKWLGDLFIDLIRMLIGPVIFCTVVLGIANGGDMKKAGRVGFKALVYFEVLSTFALAIGLIAANVLKPGAEFHANVAQLDASAVADYATKAQGSSFLDIVRHIIPHTFFSAFSTDGDLLQILLIAVLFGYGVHRAGAIGQKAVAGIEVISKIFFAMVAGVMRFAPIGAFGAMAFTVGKYGVASLGPQLKLMGVFYLSCFAFVFLVLGAVARLMGFRITRFLLYIKDELLTILATSSSESALVPLMEKLEKLGCSKAVVGLVVPAGYSFNLDGTNIYLTLAALFVAQATGVDLTLSQQLSLLLVAIVTSKGASGVTGAGFITLAATMMVVPSLPVAGLSLILGIDRFMSEARAITNAIGNGVATIVIARWEGELDTELLQRELNDSLETTYLEPSRR